MLKEAELRRLGVDLSSMPVRQLSEESEDDEGGQNEPELQHNRKYGGF